MSITYSYEIIAVNEAARAMEVVYTAEGHPTQHIGARLPYEGETLEQVIQMYAPVSFWEELQRPIVVPQVGVSGVIEPVVEPVGEPIELQNEPAGSLPITGV